MAGSSIFPLGLPGAAVALVTWPQAHQHGEEGAQLSVGTGSWAHLPSAGEAGTTLQSGL